MNLRGSFFLSLQRGQYLAVIRGQYLAVTRGPFSQNSPVSGYTRSNGTYVESHIRTMPNDTNWDNFSTKGNSNPFTGSTGHRARDYSRDAYNYGAGHNIHTGSRGGQYYYNSNGHKTYVPKRNLW